jgi:HlyD family secretion protein
VVILFLFFRNSDEKIEYETAKVKLGPLLQTVDATGQLQSAEDLSLRFETVGVLSEIKVKEGDVVKQGALLANLRLSELNASVAQASANLQKQLAGPTDADKRYYEAAVDSALASFEQAKATALKTISDAEADLETAKNNLKMAEGGESSRIVAQEYEDAVALSYTALSKLDNALTQSDNILGLDNTLANDDYEDLLGLKNTNSLTYANNSYLAAKLSVNESRSVCSSLVSVSSHESVDKCLDKLKIAEEKTNTLLSDMQIMLGYTAPVGDLSQTELDTFKTAIETARASVGTQYTNLTNQIQSIKDAKNSYSTYLIAYNKSLQDYEEAKASASSSVLIKEAAYKQAQATLDSKIVPPREVDVASYRAALSQAVANRDKAVVTAPIDGVITQINKKRGEVVGATDVVLKLLSPNYEIKVDVPETDISKIQLQNPVDITLDAFGSDTKFSGVITNIDPASTEIQDVVYFKVKISMQPSDKPIKPGMTANVVIKTDSRENVFQIPSRAVRNDKEYKYVRVLDGKEIKEVKVGIGIKANNGYVEILNGLNENQEVIISQKTKQ